MILSIKLKNQIMKIAHINLEFKLKNIQINGVKKGCSGFIQNKDNGKIVYVSTEESSFQPFTDKSLYRTATSMSDFTGGYNNFAINENLSACIVKMLS